MPRKLNSFQILKLDSKTLKRKNYKIETTLETARRHGQIIKLAENTFLEVIKRVSRKSIDFQRVDEISSEIKKLGKEKNSNTNRDAIKSLIIERDALVYIPEVVMIEFSDKRHYGNIIKQGLYINGKEYVRGLAGAGNIRKNSVFFIDKDIYEETMGILNNGRNESVLLNPAKFSAYFGLYASAGQSVSSPRFAVVPDYHYKRMATVDWVDENNRISEKTDEITLNAFDGQGLISPSFSYRWAEELGLDYIPSAFIFRAPFMKGQVVTFDFHLLAEENNVVAIKDMWGDEIDIDKVDIIFSESQAKLWDSYPSMGDYVDHMEARKLSFRVCRYNHRELRHDTSSNYMYLQVLDLDDNAVEELCESTVEHFRDIQQSDVAKSALFLSGISAFPHDFSRDNFDKLDVISKAILTYPDLLNERYISSRISGVLDKKKKQSKLGKLLFKGNYSPMGSDPYAHAQWVLGLEVTGLLKEDQHYSDFWSNQGAEYVASARSPLTHNSEMQKFKIVSGWESDKWYKYLGTVFVLPFMSLDTLYMSDSDFDGDGNFTTDHNVFMDKRIKGLPINYEHGLAKKINVTSEHLHKSDLDGMNAKIGFLTNTSSSLHCMMYGFPEDSDEHDELNVRSKLCRMLQGEEIDGAKNAGKKRIMPSYWTNYDKDSSDLDKKVLADKRPYFTRYLYPSYDKRYRDGLKSMDRYCWSHFDKSYGEILKEEAKSDKMVQAIERYKRFSFFMEYPSPMNKVCWYMEKELDRIDNKVKSKEFDYTKLYSSMNVMIDKKKLEEMRKLMNKYLSLKKAWRKSSSEFRKDIWHIISEVGDIAKSKISSNSVELADLCVALMLETSRADAFSWTVFGDSIIENILARHGRQIDILVEDDFGEEEFLFRNYSKKRVFI